MPALGTRTAATVRRLDEEVRVRELARPGPLRRLRVAEELALVGREQNRSGRDAALAAPVGEPELVRERRAPPPAVPLDEAEEAPLRLEAMQVLSGTRASGGIEELEDVVPGR